MIKNRFTHFLFLALICAAPGWAINPPPPVAPTLASVILTITPATVRADNITPMAASEIKEHRLYFTQLSAYIAVPMPNLTYTYIVPSGSCFKSSDSVAATTVDIGTLESAASVAVSVPEDRCSGKSLPKAPVVKITGG